MLIHRSSCSTSKNSTQPMISRHKGFYITSRSLRVDLKLLLREGQNPNSEKLAQFTKKLDFQICRAATYYRNELTDIKNGVVKIRHTWKFLTPQNFPSIYERCKELVANLRDILIFMEVNSDCVRRLHLMMASETETHNLIKEKLRPDNVSSSFRELRIHKGTKELIRELHKKIDRLRFLESQWLHKGYITADFTRAVHCRRNTNFLVTELYAVAHETANRTDWYYKLMIEAEVDYESQPVGKCDWWGLFLNNLNTFLYMANYYLVIPTAAEYAIAVGMAGSTSGILLSMTPFASLFASIVYSLWSNYNFKMPLMFCNLVLIAGNLLYAMAFDAKQPWMLFAGRLLVGVGGNRAVNRRYISDFVPLEKRTLQSAIFVTVGSLGMSLGPGMQPLINKLPAATVPYLNISFNSLTAPVLIMCGWWVIFALMTLAFFNEPSRSTTIERPELFDPLTQDPASAIATNYNTYMSGIVAADESKIPETYKVNTAEARGLEPSGKPRKNLVMSNAIFRRISLLQFMDTTEVGVLLAAIGLIVLPSNILIGWMGGSIPDRVGQTIALIVLIIGFFVTFSGSGVVFSASITPTRYVSGAFVVFIAAQALESINMALLSRLMPKALSKGLWNSGFLSTEAGTLGRVVGAALISFVGSLVAVEQMQDMVNIASIILILATLWLCVLYWSSLIPLNERFQNEEQEAGRLEDIVDAVEDIVLKPLCKHTRSVTLSHTLLVHSHTSYTSYTSHTLRHPSDVSTASASPYSLRQMKSRVGRMFEFPSSRAETVKPLQSGLGVPSTMHGLQSLFQKTIDIEDEPSPWASIAASVVPPAHATHPPQVTINIPSARPAEADPNPTLRRPR
eukprot:Gregarina_sp_Poly_1__6880@NODE_372_length_9144_cov_60_017517_g307_i0_p2_GENE_NODE_372_length_9144_cov_60_017517_g307_i0NODE_372_length_9144_cov_60_017517_g307_i0_p2_ORF_typecomplete_len852_score84_03MFS_1/PF07690_16/2_5e16MFS_1/PF07690_16/0_0007MFS_1_like/PF12832_7/0_55MFS_1_like/PF12832_7/0_031ABC_membrane_3/PF13748_6/0_068TM_helix/PF05552_12/1_3e04TM_helix/PF05552_12/35TM_helix/PF05552_12/3_3_NODE_372_length_9144_cov_60_017517_g307_i019194474